MPELHQPPGGRRGKNVLKGVFKEEATRAAICAQLDNFKSQWITKGAPTAQAVLGENFGVEETNDAKRNLLDLLPGDTTWPFIQKEEV